MVYEEKKIGERLFSEFNSRPFLCFELRRVEVGVCSFGPREWIIL